MGKTRRPNSKLKSENPNSARLDLAGLPPWYLLTYSHGTPGQGVCSHMYLYSDKSIYGPDFTVCVKYNPSTDNTLEDPELTVETHAY